MRHQRILDAIEEKKAYLAVLYSYRPIPDPLKGKGHLPRLTQQIEEQIAKLEEEDRKLLLQAAQRRLLLNSTEDKPGPPPAADLSPGAILLSTGAKEPVPLVTRRINPVAADFDNFAGRLMFDAHEKLRRKGLRGSRHRKGTPDLPTEAFLEIVRKVDGVKTPGGQSKYSLKEVLTKRVWEEIAKHNRAAGPSGQKLSTLAEAAVFSRFKQKIHHRFNRAEIFYREHIVQKQS
jgi:hypothetical protein